MTIQSIKTSLTPEQLSASEQAAFAFYWANRYAIGIGLFPYSVAATAAFEEVVSRFLPRVLQRALPLLIKALAAKPALVLNFAILRIAGWILYIGERTHPHLAQDVLIFIGSKLVHLSLPIFNFSQIAFQLSYRLESIPVFPHQLVIGDPCGVQPILMLRQRYRNLMAHFHPKRAAQHIKAVFGRLVDAIKSKNH